MDELDTDGSSARVVSSLSSCGLQRNPRWKTLVAHAWTNQEDSYKENTSTLRKRDEPSTTIKAPISSQIEVHIIDPSLALWSCENKSNLTFEGYLAGTTLVLSVRLYFFLQVIVSSVRGSYNLLVIFTISSVGAVCGEGLCRLAILSLPGHRVAWYLLAQWRQPTTFKETNLNPLP